MIHSLDVLTQTDGSSDRPTKEELHTTQGKNLLQLTTFECWKEWTIWHLTTGLKRFLFFAKGAVVCSRFHPWTLVFLQPSPRRRLCWQVFKGYPRPVLNVSSFEGLLKPCQTLRRHCCSWWDKDLGYGQQASAYNYCLFFSFFGVGGV